MRKLSKTYINLTPLPVILFVVFITLKLANVIDWSWWWVTSPLWIGMALAMLFCAGILFVIAFGFGLALIFGKAIQIKRSNKK